MTTFYLIRHGITDWIEAGLVQGISDRPLSDAGKEQAELTAKALKNINFDRIYSSPQLRAKQTAQPICKINGMNAVTIEGLQEMDQGWLEGKRDPWRIVRDRVILRNLFTLIHDFILITSGESHAKFENRVLKAWQPIRSLKVEKPVIVVAHAGVIHAILMYELGIKKKDSNKFYTDNCSINQIEIDAEGVARQVRLNDVSHLDGKVRQKK